MLELSSAAPDPALVEDLFDRHAARVQRHCRRLLRNPEEARDAAQEVFLRLMLHGQDFRGHAQWTTWLYRIATNLCLDRLRSASRRDASWAEALVASTGETPSPEAAALSRRALDALLSEADDCTRRIVVLHFLEGLSQQEVADAMGLSRVTVNKRLMRLRGRSTEPCREAA